MSQQMKVRPSEVYFVTDEVAAWCFDRAVTTFGLLVESDIRNAAENAKNDKAAKAAAQRALMKWLRDDPNDMRGMFKDPMGR